MRHHDYLSRDNLIDELEAADKREAESEGSADEPMTIAKLRDISGRLDRWWDADHNSDRRYGQALMDAMSRIDSLINDMKENGDEE